MTPFQKSGTLLPCALFAVILGAAPQAHADTFPYWGVSFGTPGRAAGTLGVSFGDAIPGEAEGLAIGTGAQIEASVGRGGAKLGIGRSIVILTEEKAARLLADVKAVGIRTFDRARGASPHSTYLGVEGGLSLSVLRLTLGVAKRLETKSVGADVLFTWGVGLQIRIGRRAPQASSDGSRS